jgi:hypothetical protein
MATDEKALKPADITGAKKPNALASRFANQDPESLRRRGIDPDTFERKAVTWKGLLEEFGKPAGPRLYNAIAVAAFGGVPSNKADLSIMTLQDDYIMPRGRDELDEAFNARLEKHRARRAKVEQLIAEAEGGNG